MRCTSCNKFVGYGDPRTDEIEIEVDETTVTMSGLLYLTCADCGEDLKSADMDDEQEATFPEIEDELPEGCEITYEHQDDAEIEPFDRVQDVDRKGKKIKNHRYMKTFYGVTASVDVHRIVRDKDGNELEKYVAVATVELSAECPASGFDELN